MWYGVGEYFAVVAIAAFVVHLFIRAFGTSCLVGAALCSILNLLHERGWVACFDFNPGLVPMFIGGAILALPVCAVAGLPFLVVRASRRPNAEPLSGRDGPAGAP